MDKTPPKIEFDALLEAAKDHSDRVALHGPQPMERTLYEARFDPEDTMELLLALRDKRNPPDQGAFAVGFVDGLIIGARAARITDGEDS